MSRTLQLISSILLFSIACSMALQGRVNELLPTPKELIFNGGAAFQLTGMTALRDTGHVALLHMFLADKSLTVNPKARRSIIVSYVDNIAGAAEPALSGYEPEAYRLLITSDTIAIEAVSTTGVIRAVQTLYQLAADTIALPALTLTDWPAFKVRGWMHDVGRSFIPFDELKREVDLLSRFKLNTFHWHLTEDQAWRFEVRACPQLTASGTMTRFPGCYYTQAECRDLVAYALERGVTVIPEIDMPGHSRAFERAMGCSMQSEEGITVLTTVLDELAAVFAPCPYIDIGGDEVPIISPAYLPRMARHIRARGKRVVTWNPLRNQQNDSSMTDMTHLWSTRGRVVTGIPAIDSRYNYVNHFDVFADLVGIFKSNIYYLPQGNDQVAGSITAVWNDRKLSDWRQIICQNNFYANCLASVERSWKGGGAQYIELGGTQLPLQGDEYDEFRSWEERFLYHKSHLLRKEPIPYVRQTNILWRISDPFPNDGNVAIVFPPELSTDSILPESYSYRGITYGSRLARGGAVYLKHAWRPIVPSFFDNPMMNTTAYAWTYVYSPVEQTAGALVEFQNYGRSETDASPLAGTWDYKGSTLFVNDEEVAPPIWDNSGVPINAEVELRNENCTNRAPTLIHLRAGWNRILMRLPFVDVRSDLIRLNKWMFTFVLTDTAGINALEGVVYSPSRRMDGSVDTDSMCARAESNVK